MSVTGTRCVVPGCESTKSAFKNQFPRNIATGKLWLKAIQNPVLSSKSYEEILRKAYFVCRKHFSAEFLTSVGRRSLKEGAVPTLFMPAYSNEESTESNDLSIDAPSSNTHISNMVSVLPIQVSPSLRYIRSPTCSHLRRSGMSSSQGSPLKATSTIKNARRLFIVGKGETSSCKKLYNITSENNSYEEAEGSSFNNTVFMDDFSSHLPKYSTHLSQESFSMSTTSKVLEETEPATVTSNDSEIPSTSTSATVIKDSPMTMRNKRLGECMVLPKVQPPKTPNTILRSYSRDTSKKGSPSEIEDSINSTVQTSNDLLTSVSHNVSKKNVDTVKAYSRPKKSCNTVRARAERRILKMDDLKEVDVTPKGQFVMNQLRLLKKDLRRYRKQFRRKKNEIAKDCRDICRKFSELSKTQQAIVGMQIRNAQSKKSGRRFTEEEKDISMAIFKRSPKAYRFLTELLILPPISTVKHNLCRIELDTGINTNIANLLKECVASMKDEREKVVILMWDETHLKSEIHYDFKKDKFIGFEDFGNECTSYLANEILVFMIRGLWTNAKLPISYYFSNGQATTDRLCAAVKDNIQMLQQAGFQVVATVCDGRPSNDKVLKELREQYVMECISDQIEPYPKDGIVVFGGQKMCLLHDTIHMCKCGRNMQTKHLLEINYPEADSDPSLPRKYVKWEHYVKAFYLDLRSQLYLRHIPKVTEAHVNPKKMKRMKVSHCCQVLSLSMAEWIYICVLMQDKVTTQGNIKMEPEALHTAEYTKFADELFDSINSRKKKKDALAVNKPLQQVLTDKSPHLKFWNEAIQKLSTMRYRDLDNVNPPKANDSRRRFIRTLRLMPEVWNIVKEKGFPYLKTGYINQDPLKNFFGQLKEYGARNVLPSCSQAEAQLKASLVSSLSNKNLVGFFPLRRF